MLPCESCGRSEKLCDCTREQLRSIIESKAIVAACIRTVGGFLAITGSNNALLLWSATMRDANYPTARAKLIASGHLEIQLIDVERKAIEAAKNAGHPIPKDPS